MDRSNDADQRLLGEIPHTGECSAEHGLHAPDSLSQKGAMALARRLQDFWHAQGYPAARFWAEPVAERFAKIGTYELYRVESNLVNGIPPRYRDEE